MDELDRMFRRLVQNIRAGSPDLLTRPFEVTSLHQHIIPYRLNRAALGIDSAEEYELALMRLLAGTRGLLSGDPDMQAALTAELESPNPDLSLFRAWSTASVSVNAAAVRELDSQTTAALRRPSPAVATTTRQAEIAARATVEVQAPAAPAVTQVAAPAATTVKKPATEAAAPAARTIAAAPSAGHGTGCRYCGSELPDGRDAHFCPHCGQNLTVKQCPACSTELEIDWQFCITCGRQSE